MHEEDIEKKINPVEFKRLYREELRQAIKEINKISEQEEKKAKRICISFILLMIGMFLIINFGGWAGGLIILIAPIIIVIFFIAAFKSAVNSAFAFIKGYEKESKIKATIYEKLFSFVGDFKFINYTPQERENIAKELLKSRIFPPVSGNTYIDDHIRGTYKNLKIRIYEIRIISKEKKILNYIYLQIPCNKNFKGYTLIREKSNIKDKGKTIELEDINFNEYFSVKSNDEIEARYLITPGLMQRLNKFKRRKIFSEMSILFERRDIHILIPTNKDWFQLPLSNKVISEQALKRPILELYSLMEIIDEFKLDQDIGM